MRYYCLGKSISLIKWSHSKRFWKNLPGIQTPLYQPIPVTRNKAERAFHESSHLILCKSFDDAKAFRRANVLFTEDDGVIDKPKTDDYVIYEIELSDDVFLQFSALNNLSVEQIRDFNLEPSNVLLANKVRRNNLPDIEVCLINKIEQNPKLIDYHFISLETEKKELSEGGCRCIVQ